MRNTSGFTLSEVLTAVVALVVLAAVAIPMWRTHELRARRDDAVEALLAVQAAQDQYFGKNARYADESQLGASGPAGLGIAPNSRRGFYQITLRNSADNLTYWASARVRRVGDETADTRCVEMRIDQNGRRFAVDSEGVDRSADCWSAN
ncbi:MAG TPA: type IV pilin protein [Steroidobacteraceae bacterium]|jgi:type IV pilus assembly protein PilE|nr:type IV pilin protein [Steroidobacteraceae bacterium]